MNQDSKYFNKFISNYLILIINLIFTEIIFRILSNYSILDWAFLRIIIGLNLVAIIVSLISSSLPKKASKIVTIILAFLFSIYTFLQIGFNNYLGVYMSFGTSSQFGAVKDYVIEFLSSLSWTYYLIFIPVLITILFLIFLKKYIKIYEFQKKSVIYLIFVFVFSIILAISYRYTITADFMQNSLQQVSNLELLKNPSVPSITIKEFGTIGYGFLDIKALILPKPEEENIENEEEPVIIKEEEKTDYTRIIDNRAWLTAIENEKNSVFNNLNKYFINRDITDKNDFTGLFENKNVIIIMMESVNDIIVNEEFYPNFYKLYTEGWNFSNHYSPRNSCATGNNEMSGMTGLYSINDSCTANKYKTNTYYEAIFNLFNNKGYKTSSMHNFTEGYYRRSIIHKNMGSSQYYGVQALKIPYQVEYGKWASDEDFFKKVLSIIDGYDEETKFMTWLTTVSSHQPYSVSSPYGDIYLNVFKNTKYNLTTKRYMSKLKVLDNAIGILINGLEERNLLNDTVIVLFADHYPYGLAKSNIQAVLGHSVANDSLADKTPLVIYNPEIEAHDYKQYTTYMNLTPTLANLFNLDYDPRLYFGYDVLSADYQSIVVFADGSWKNEHAYYNASNSKVNYYDDFYSIDDIKKISNDIVIQMKMSALAIKNNYFNYLNKSLDKYKIIEPEPVIEELETSSDEIIENSEESISEEEENE